jgi:hypothetical protein
VTKRYRSNNENPKEDELRKSKERRTREKGMGEKKGERS